MAFRPQIKWMSSHSSFRCVFIRHLVTLRVWSIILPATPYSARQGATKPSRIHITIFRSQSFKFYSCLELDFHLIFHQLPQTCGSPLTSPSSAHNPSWTIKFVPLLWSQKVRTPIVTVLGIPSASSTVDTCNITNTRFSYQESSLQ